MVFSLFLSNSYSYWNYRWTTELSAKKRIKAKIIKYECSYLVLYAFNFIRWAEISLPLYVCIWAWNLFHLIVVRLCCVGQTTTHWSFFKCIIWLLIPIIWHKFISVVKSDTRAGINFVVEQRERERGVRSTFNVFYVSLAFFLIGNFIGPKIREWFNLTHLHYCHSYVRRRN